jgi:hypothetical protein
MVSSREGSYPLYYLPSHGFGVNPLPFGSFIWQVEPTGSRSL